ncbi:hypothetical protein KIL84_016782, partial [Mauremys mutica]
MSMALDIHPEEVWEKSHKLMDILTSAAPPRIALPIDESFLEPTKILWHTPASYCKKNGAK